MRGHRDLRLVVALSVVCAAVALVIPFEAVRIAAAVPLCLVLPGYAVVSAAFGSRQLERGRFAALTLGMSLATLVLCALVLNYMPGGIRDVTWAAILVLVVTAASRWAAIHRSPGKTVVRGGRPLRVRRRDALMLGGGGLAAIVALIVSATVYPAPDAIGYTRLWMLPTASGSAARVGVGSNEQRPQSYLLRVRLGGRELLHSSLSLDPGEERVMRVPIGPVPGGEPRRLTASLYRKGRPEVLYRRVTSWVGPDKSQR
jgi:uncharacterized membrane protein